jgi:hypothetical protein
MKQIISGLIILSLAVLIQTSLVAWPVVIMALYFAYKSGLRQSLYILAFVTGLFVDSMTVNTLGVSMLFYLFYVLGLDRGGEMIGGGVVYEFVWSMVFGFMYLVWFGVLSFWSVVTFGMFIVIVMWLLRNIKMERDLKLSNG